MGSTLDISKIVSEYGKYYENAGQNKNRLVRALVQPSESLEKHARRIPTNDTIYKMANYTFQSVIRPFAKTFDPNSSISFFPNQIQLRQMKVDAEIYPNEIEEAWIAFLAANNATVKDWPIVRFLMEEYLVKQIAADRENNMVYKGVYNASGTTPSDCLDGIKKLLLTGVNNADYPINVISGIGALDADTIFDQVEKFDEALPELYNEQKVVIFMSPKWSRAFKKDKRSQGFFFIQDIKEIDESVDFSKHYVAALPSMSGTNDMFATVADNLLWLTKREGNLANMQVQAHDRCVHIMVDWWEGLGFGCNQMVWTTAETVGSTASDSANPADGIFARNIYVQTGASKDIASTTAKVTGKIITDEDLENATIAIVYGTVSGTLSSSSTPSLASGTYTSSLTGLSASTKYYYALKVTIGTDVYLGVEKDFTTEATS